MAKKYFWLKIQEEFFRQKEIKALRKMEKGPLYILIYQKMLVYSLQNNISGECGNLSTAFSAWRRLPSCRCAPRRRC